MPRPEQCRVPPASPPIFDPWPHPACLSDEELLKQCHLGKSRSSGPGGQHRNKVETEVTLTHEPTGLAGKAGERRSAVENKRMALRRLRLVLAVNVRVGVPTGEIGSVLWKSRCRAGKIACNPNHHDYPSMLAEALDVIAASGGGRIGGGWDLSTAALRLGCSASQLLKLVKEHPPALALLNAEREKKGKGTLK